MLSACTRGDDVQVVDHRLEVVDDCAIALRATVAVVVWRVHLRAVSDEPLGNVTVATRVLAEPVREQDDVARIAVLPVMHRERSASPLHLERLSFHFVLLSPVAGPRSGGCAEQPACGPQLSVPAYAREHYASRSSAGVLPLSADVAVPGAPAFRQPVCSALAVDAFSGPALACRRRRCAGAFR